MRIDERLGAIRCGHYELATRKLLEFVRYANGRFWCGLTDGIERRLPCRRRYDWGEGNGLPYKKRHSPYVDTAAQSLASPLRSHRHPAHDSPVSWPVLSLSAGQ